MIKKSFKIMKYILPVVVIIFIVGMVVGAWYLFFRPMELVDVEINTLSHSPMFEDFDGEILITNKHNLDIVNTFIFSSTNNFCMLAPGTPDFIEIEKGKTEKLLFTCINPTNDVKIDFTVKTGDKTKTYTKIVKITQPAEIYKAVCNGVLNCEESVCPPGMVCIMQKKWKCTGNDLSVSYGIHSMMTKKDIDYRIEFNMLDWSNTMVGNLIPNDKDQQTFAIPDIDMEIESANPPDMVSMLFVKGMLVDKKICTFNINPVMPEGYCRGNLECRYNELCENQKCQEVPHTGCEHDSDCPVSVDTYICEITLIPHKEFFGECVIHEPEDINPTPKMCNFDGICQPGESLLNCPDCKRTQWF